MLKRKYDSERSPTVVAGTLLGGKGPLNVKIFPSFFTPKSSLTLCLLVPSNLITFANSLDPKQAQQNVQPGTEVIKLLSCSTQLSTKFIRLINVKMPTIKHDKYHI